MSAKKRLFESDSEESDTSKRVKKPSPTGPTINSFQNAVASIHTLCAFIAVRKMNLKKEDLDMVLASLNNGIEQLESARKSLNDKMELYKNSSVDGLEEVEKKSPYKGCLADESTTQNLNTDEVTDVFIKEYCKFIRKIYTVIEGDEKHTLAKIFALERTLKTQMTLLTSSKELIQKFIASQGNASDSSISATPNPSTSSSTKK
ncbi:uncharacterized protein LOC129579680 [Sitodiplosis mosellana]|uniref:uncharacterized protein LOC129579680 n=1 Tax=Sitodiplosis mosellana TaxID=263140 RepID=UPI002443BC41|nr:uncharacterized protein LOC129579680 [Sitodiplosis mosellana]